MTLENAVQTILKNTVTWIKGNSASRPGWVVTNFPNFFLHECNLLVCTSEFKNWRDLNYLRKPRFLSFDFDVYGDIKSVKFNIPEVYNSSQMSRLNALLQQTCHLYWHEGIIGEEEIKNIYQELKEVVHHQPVKKAEIFATEGPKVLFDIKKLENFKF